jgi:recombination protein RecR
MRELPLFEKLTSCLARLPGVGRRSAERMALAIMREPERLGAELAAALEDVRSTVCTCSRCGNLTARDANPCRLCTSPSRTSAQLCVVEEPGDILQFEKAGAFTGRYHALMGRLSPMKGEGPAALRVQALLERLEPEGVQEVILAVSTDVEGDATASYLTEQLRGRGVKVTRLAFGLPAGSGVAYADALTLTRALRGREPM